MSSEKKMTGFLGVPGRTATLKRVRGESLKKKLGCFQSGTRSLSPLLSLLECSTKYSYEYSYIHDT